MQSGVDQVLARRRRASETLRSRIEQRTDRDGEVRALLDDIRDRLIEISRSGRRWSSPPGVLPTEVDVGHLSTRLHDPEDHIPPPPLDSSHLAGDDGDGDGATFEELVRYGGPNYQALHDAISERLANNGIVSVAEVFAGLDPEMRRPVDLLGLLQLAGADAPTGGLTTHRSVRPDGSEVDLRTAGVLITNLEDQP